MQLLPVNQSLRQYQIETALRNLALIFLLGYLFIGLFAEKVSAETISLSTYPSTIQLRAVPPADARSTFMIQNKSSASVNLNIILKPFKPDTTNDGKLIYIEGNDPAILKKAQILDNGIVVTSIDLGPKQSKNLSLLIDLSENEKTADYYFSVIFLTAQPEFTEEAKDEAIARSNAQAGIGLNVLLNVGPKELPNGYLSEFTTLPFRSAGPVPFTVKIKNNGNHYFTPKGVILIKNIFGQTVGRIDLQNTNILVGTVRSMLGTPYQKSASKDSDFSSQYPVWPEQFLLGFYTAELSIALSEEGPVLTHSANFLAVPIHVLIGAGITGILIFLITIRIRQKLRES